jgi:hypothetical protein
MAWNEIPAATDENLSYQAYYVRLNALRQFLSPLSEKMLDAAWENAGSAEMRALRRSAMIGLILADLIRALSLNEVTEVDIPIGDWFIHSGATSYSGTANKNQRASISMPDGGSLESIVRPECRITNTASMNMAGVDDVSLVVGRRLSATKFDLIAAGYRDPISSLRGSRVLEMRQYSSVIDRLGTHNPFPLILPTMKIHVADEYTLASAVKDTVERFSVAVEKQGAWKHLYNPNGMPAHETRHQGLFRLFSQLTFGALRIEVHPSADHGAGSTDLTLSLGNAVHVVEFKKDASTEKVLHGLRVQLPRYMQAANTIFGSYVVMCHARNREEIAELIRVSARDDYVISTFAVDCRPQRSASKAV